MTRINILKGRKPSWRKNLSNAKAIVQFRFNQINLWSAKELADHTMDITNEVAAPLQARVNNPSLETTRY